MPLCGKSGGFTLAEVLITLLIIGIIAAVTLPVVQKAHPDKLEAMRRKSYYILENTVAQMYSDDSMYRPVSNKLASGFRNTEKIKYNGKTYEGKTKFCELFADSLTKRPNSHTNCAVGQKTFTTSDNVDWYLPVTNFSDGFGEIKFDVNGKAEPNCEYDSQTCPKPDKFTYFILSSGKITESNPKLSHLKHCIRTKVTGNGTVTPSEDYCNLSSGVYTLKAVPSYDWFSNWQNNEKTVKVIDKDVNLSVVFTQNQRACIKLNVDCEFGAPENCARFNIANTWPINTNGNELSVCGLSSGNHAIIITPNHGYTSTWTEQNISLNGVDQTFDVKIYEGKYCATLNVVCPGGEPRMCGKYEIIGDDGLTYGLESSPFGLGSCALKNGNYSFNVTPNKAYKLLQKDLYFTIANRNIKGTIEFEKILTNCKEDGYFKAGGKKFSCPFSPTQVSPDECKKMAANGSGIKNCSNYTDDYWAGAVKQCGGKVSNLPTMDDLANIASLVYEGNNNLGPEEDNNTLIYSNETANSIGLPAGRYYVLWSGEEDFKENSYGLLAARGRAFYVKGTSYGRFFRSDSDYGNYKAICVIE